MNPQFGGGHEPGNVISGDHVAREYSSCNIDKTTTSHTHQSRSRKPRVLGGWGEDRVTSPTHSQVGVCIPRARVTEHEYIVKHPSNRVVYKRAHEPAASLVARRDVR